VIVIKDGEPVFRKGYGLANREWEIPNAPDGIPSYTGIKEFFPKMSRDPRTTAEIVRLTQDKPLEFEPGAEYRYNNTAYVLLGHIIEKLSGLTYAEYLRQHVLDPADMRDTGLAVSRHEPAACGGLAVFDGR
jgi:CubicO group peptidase (beta-lactamase class C family)